MTGPSLSETDPLLVARLQELFDDYGPGGVRRTVEQMIQASPESPAQILTRMGTDAAEWTNEFMRVAGGLTVRSGGPDGEPGEQAPNVNWGGMVSWFANAIEAGRTAGRRETCPHEDFTVLAPDLLTCSTCGLLIEPAPPAT